MSELKEPSSNPTRVGVSLNYKMGLENYSSLSIGVSITDDARPGENVQQAFDRVYAFTEKQLHAKVNAELENK